MTDYVRGRCHLAVAGFTRPADTNAYTAGDVVADSTSAATLMTFGNVVRGGTPESGVILTAALICSANQPTKPDFQLWLFDTAPAVVNDNAAFAPSDTELQKLIAVISFPATGFIAANGVSGAGGNSACNPQGLWIPVNPIGTDIYGVMVAKSAYTPTSAERYDVRLGVME